jgi:hypothetical protein
MGKAGMIRDACEEEPTLKYPIAEHCWIDVRLLYQTGMTPVRMQY